MALLHTALFASGDESVRLHCEPAEADLIQLFVFGPRTRRATYTFNSADICEQFERALEERLRAEGYVRLATVERRQQPR